MLTNTIWMALEEALAAGHCLHGSSIHGLTIIETRPSFCNTGRAAGCLTAVYADPHGWRRPMLHALIQPRCPGGSQWGYGGDTEGVLYVEGENVTLGMGSIYILPRRTFDWFDDEFVSETDVPVLEEILVVPGTIRLILADIDTNIVIPPPW